MQSTVYGGLVLLLLASCRPDTAQTTTTSATTTTTTATTTVSMTSVTTPKPSAAPRPVVRPITSAIKPALDCDAPNITVRIQTPIGQPLKCVRPCAPVTYACPAQSSCVGEGKTSDGTKEKYCVADPQPVTCKEPETMAWDDRNVAFCGTPCKLDADCSHKRCIVARRDWQPTLGMAAALANDISICH